MIFRTCLLLAVVCFTPFCPSLLAGVSGPAINATTEDGVAATARKLRGDTINYTNQVNNTGTSDATGVTVTDATPANTTFVNGSLKVTPIALDDSYTAIGNTILTNGAPGVLANDFDPDNIGGGFTVKAGSVSHTGGSANPAGNLAINADGSFTYTPGVGATGTDVFRYTITDADGLDSVTPGIVSFTMTARVWYVQNASSNGDGRSTTPFNNMASVNTAATLGTDIIYIFSDTGNAKLNGNFILKNNQQLIGQGNTLTVSGLTPFTAGTAPTIGNTGGDIVTLGTNNVVAGLTLNNRSGSAIIGNNFVALTLTNATISGTGQALNLTTGTVNATLASVSASGVTTGISLTGVNGTLTMNGGTLSGLSGTDFFVSGGAATISYPGDINNTAGRSVDINGHTGGTITLSGNITDTGTGIIVQNCTGGTTTFNGTTKTLTTGGSTAVSLTSNTGSTINFTNGGLNITTTTGNGFNATGGGTVTVTTGGTANIISSGNGSGLNVANTTIGASGLTFQSISSSGGSATGIILDGTGNSGGLTVTGTGSAASGGTIANKTGSDGATTSGNGIYLNNTTSPSFTRMQLNDFQNFAIFGNNVTGFTLRQTVVNGINGTSVSGLGEGDVYFTGLIGSATIADSSFSGGTLDTFHVFNNGGQNLNRITITNCSFATVATAGNQSGDALVFQATDGTFNATVQSSKFTSARGDLFQLDLHGGVTSDLIFGGATALLGNTLTNGNLNIVSGGGGITISSGGAGDHVTLTFNFGHNTMRDALGTALGISTGSGLGAFTGTIDSNTIGVAGVASSGSVQGSDIGFVTDGGTNSSITIINNQLFQYGNGSGIYLQTGDSANGGNAQLTAVVQGNTASNPGSFGAHGIESNFGTVSSPADAQKVCLTLGGSGSGQANSIAGSGGGGGTDIRLRERFTVRVGLLDTPNYAGAATDSAAITSYLQPKNNGNGTPTVSITSGTQGYFGTCPP